MKIILSLLVLVTSTVIFYSCKSDVVTSPAQVDNFQWQLKDSLPGESVNYISIADEENIYLATINSGMRINNGVKTQINFQSGDFQPWAVDAYSSTYYAYAGINRTGSPSTSLKIFNGTNLTTVVIDPDSNLALGLVKILQPGKILISTVYYLYVYDNGKLTAYSLGVEGFAYKVGIFNGKIYLAVTAYNGHQLVYRFDNNALELLEDSDNSSIKLSVDDAIIGVTRTDRTYLGYYGGPVAIPIIIDSLKRDYFWASGQDLNLIYLFAFDTSDLNKVTGMIWSGGKLYRDKNFPFDAHNSFTAALSNMRSGSFYLCDNKLSPSVSYIYKVKKYSSTQTEN